MKKSGAKKIKLTPLLILLLVSTSSIAKTETLREKASKIRRLFHSGDLKKAGTLTRKILASKPESLYFLSQLEIILNRQKRTKAADKVREQILKIWKEKHRQQWIAAGSPIRNSAWVRMIVESSGYIIYACEYYQPQVLGKTFALTSYYKLIIKPKHGNGRMRLFKLEMSNLTGKYHVLREFNRNGGTQIIPYGPYLPTLRRVVSDFKKYLKKVESLKKKK